MRSTDPATQPPDAADPHETAIEENEPRNFVVIALHQIVLRTGWTFKAESVITPAFFDQLAGASWLRGCLPLVRHLGACLPPALAAGWLQRLPRKQWALAGFAALLSLPMTATGVLSLVRPKESSPALAVAFLSLLFAFFVIHGIYLLSLGTIQGKLIRYSRRGRLLWTAMLWGVIPAVVLPWWLMPGWLRDPQRGWGCLFLFAACCFFLSGLVLLWIREPARRQVVADGVRRGGLAEAWQSLRRDPRLRLLAVVALLFGFSYAVNPHYQAFARIRLGIGEGELVKWVIAQTITVSLCSLVVGPLADRRGYRVTLRLALLGTALGPVVAMLVGRLPTDVAAHAYWLAFIPLGISPLVGPLLANYALELGSTEEHPRFVSTVSLALMPAYLLSPAIGQLVDVAGFEWVFGGTALALGASVALTWWLYDPRRHPHDEAVLAAPSEDD
jgi:hypothetical protein